MPLTVTATLEVSHALAHNLGNYQQAPKEAKISAKAIVWIGSFVEIRIFQRFFHPL